MKVEFYLNEEVFSHEHKKMPFTGYEKGDRLTLAYTLELDQKSDELNIDGMADMRVAEMVFEIFNIDHPKDYMNRSMCTGDVVVIDGRAYSCESFGFVPTEIKDVA